MYRLSVLAVALFVAQGFASPSQQRMPAAVPVKSTSEACLMVCFPEKPDCQKPSYAAQFGQCWTCCTKIGEDDFSHGGVFEI